MNWRPLIGGFMLAEMWTFLSLNILCLYCMKRGRLYANKDNPAYVITTFNLLSETCQLLCHVVYIGPSILLGDFFFEGGQGSLGVTVVATWFLGFWYLGSFIQVLMAANRLCVVFFPGKKILTHGRLKITAVVLFLLALGAVIYSQLLSPCCRITPDPKYFAYSYLVFENQTDNPSMRYIDLPIDMTTSIVCATSYCALFSYVYRMEKGEMGRKLKEIRICFQFLIMFLAYTVAWSTFFLLPMFDVSSPEPYMITAAAVVTNCGVNAVVYLTLNKEVKLELGKLVGKVKPSAVGTSGRVGQTADSSHQDQAIRSISS